MARAVGIGHQDFGDLRKNGRETERLSRHSKGFCRSGGKDEILAYFNKQRSKVDV
ncbi:hypothetical protein AALA00_07140 [Lachnospiraceae bacterium 46-15]